MKTCDQLQTMAITYDEICQGEEPWIPLGNFMNDFFGNFRDRREELIKDPIQEPSNISPELHRWAVFCAASVEWLCEHYGLPYPLWVNNPAYTLSQAWFDSPGAHKPEIRKWLIEETPEPFTRRNIYCGNRMFLNKYELAEQIRRQA
jgi:hypothetical protein